MTALKMMLCGEIQKSVEHREKEFKTYDELRAVVMKWAINRKIENERSTHEPMDCNQAQNWDPAWGTPEEWNWGSNQEEKQEPPTDVDYMNNNQKGKGKGDWKSGGFSGGGKRNSSIQHSTILLSNDDEINERWRKSRIRRERRISITRQRSSTAWRRTIRMLQLWTIRTHRKELSQAKD